LIVSGSIGFDNQVFQADKKLWGLAKAVVSDRGGTLSHTAIVGREYGLPTLVNTFTGTATIKTGQRIRVNATEGTLYIPDK
jgi:pyruvate,water dikinase